MKKKISILMTGLILTSGLFTVQPALASSGNYDKEYCAISQADKCKQCGTSCDGRKICFWKDTALIVAIGAGHSAIAANLD
jgi:hypothetical protein